MNCKRFASKIPALGLALIVIAALGCPQSPSAMDMPTDTVIAPDNTDPEQSADTPPPAQPDIAPVVKATNQFGLELLAELTRGGAAENRLVSPASIAIALTMTMNGAAAETRQAMAGALGLSSLEDPQINQAHLDLRQSLTRGREDTALTIANSLWARQGMAFEQPFLEMNKRFFEARVQPLDFSRTDAADIINGWVSEATREKISEIVEGPIDPATILFLINAVYFKGAWTEPFDPTLTKDEPFHPAEGQPFMAPMMQRKGYFDLHRDEDYQAVRLPYGEEKSLSMILVLPREGLAPEALLADMPADGLAAMASVFRSLEGDLKVPRFTMRDDLQLKAPLSALGMGIAFTPQADFSRMIAPPSQALIDSVRHSTFIEVNEEGTEAAAATSVVMALTAVLEKPRVVFDRPFLFMIRDESSGLTLFLGIVNDPRGGETAD